MAHPTRVWRSQFPLLADSDDPAIAEAFDAARFSQIPAGTVLFRPGTPCSQYLLVVTGRVRVQITGDNGRQVVLYRVEPGQACVLTTSCLLSHDHYPAMGIAETEMSALLLPQSHFEDAVARSGDFRRFVFAELGSRLAQLFARIEAVALEPLEHRLARLLLELGGDAGVVNRTHQDLAAELGTAREVISRALARFEQRGWVETGRGHIRLLQRAAIAACAAA